MPNCKCPYCNERTISYWTKIKLQPWKFIYPRLPAICKSCKNAVTVPLWSYSILILFVLIYFFALISVFIYLSNSNISFTDTNITFLAVILGVIILGLYILVYLRSVPLIKWDNSKL